MVSSSPLGWLIHLCSMFSKCSNLAWDQDPRSSRFPWVPPWEICFSAAGSCVETHPAVFSSLWAGGQGLGPDKQETEAWAFLFMKFLQEFLSFPPLVPLNLWVLLNAQVLCFLWKFFLLTQWVHVLSTLHDYQNVLSHDKSSWLYRQRSCKLFFFQTRIFYAYAFIFKGGLRGTEEVAQWLRALVALVEDLGFTPSTHMSAHNHL